MVGKWCWAAAWVVTIGIGIGIAERVEACFVCSPQFGCASVPTGYQSCAAWYVFGTPLCFSSGYCAAWSLGNGGAPDAFPKLRRPIWNQTEAEIETEVNVYATITPCSGGCGIFAPGATSRVVRGVSSGDDPEAMIGEVARIMGAPIGDVSVFATGVAVGRGRIEQAFAGRDGNGLALNAKRTPGGAEVSVCRIEGRALGQALAIETLGEGDLLLVRAWIEDRECVVAMTTTHGAVGEAGRTEALKQRRASFMGRGHLLTLRGRRPPFQLAPVELNGAACR